MSDAAASARAATGGVSGRQAVRIIARGVRQAPTPFVIAVLGSALYGGATVLIAWAVGRATDRYVAPAVSSGEVGAGEILAILGLVGGVVLAATIGVVMRRIGGAVTMFGVAAQDRRRVTRQYLRLPMAWHHRHPSGQLLSNAHTDVESTWLIFMPLPMALGVLAMLAFGVVQMALIDPAMALVGGSVLPMLLIVNAVYQRRMAPLAARSQRLRAEVSEVAHESFDAALVVKAMGAEAREAQRFGGAVARLRSANVAVGLARAAFEPVVEAIPALGTLLVLAVGTQRVASGAMTSTEVVQVAFLIALLAWPVRSIGWVLGEVPRSVVAWARVEAVLGAKGEMRHGQQTLAGDGPLTVGLRGVSYRHLAGGRDDLAAPPESPEGPEATVPPVLQDAPEEVPGPSRPEALTEVTVTIPAGETVALVGSTGAGKSTLVELVVRLIDPTSGVVELDGHDVRDLAAGEIAAAVALVPQQTFLFDDTVRVNVGLGADVPDEAIWGALRAARAEDFVSALPHGLDTQVGERGASLSGGQRQRIALARALVRRPRLLVLDDATSAVDPEIELAVLAGLRRTGERASATVLLIAYRMSTISLADRVVHLEAGRVLDVGTHEELLARDPGYRRLVTAYAEQSQAVALEVGHD